MIKLRVQNFSAIEAADLELGRFNVLIGPQASGKSVLCKLVYFFIDLFREQYSFIEEGQSLDNFSEHVKELFNEWFPPSAWGPKKFSIDFEAGEYHVRLLRSEYKQALGDNYRLFFSSFFKTQYETLLEQMREAAAKAEATSRPAGVLDAIYRVRQASDEVLRRTLLSDYYSQELFIPAGRSFFTNIGRAIAAFEQGRVLDPLTLQFGRLYAGSRERGILGSVRPRKNREWSGLIEELLGGEPKYKRDKSYVLTADGRQVPFSALSSGQQELLPLLTMLEAWFGERQFRGRTLTFIEEPEAHLFPSAQSKLVELLASVVARSDSTDMVLTTHSPYVLAKLNNLAKAGQLAKNLADKSDAINKVVPARSWLQPGDLKAYAIENQKLVSLMDEDGLIDGQYLDSVSGHIAREFSELLAVEVGE